MTDWIKRIKRLQACGDAVKWCRTHHSLEEAWDNCQEPSWMLWYAARVSGEPGSTARRKLAGVLVEIVRPVALKGDSILIEVLETLVRYSQGEATVEEVRIAAVDATDAARLSRAAFVTAGTLVAASAASASAASARASASEHSASAASASASASYCATDARATADADAERDRQLTIIRKHYPEPPQ